MNEIQIRKMTIDDYEGVYRLWLGTPGMGLNTADDSREGVEKYVKRNPDTCFVAEKGGETVGVIMSGHDGRRGLIYHAAVRVSERGRGIGSSLVDRVMAALAREGINKVYLVIFSNNDIGNAFWEKRGFTVREDVVYRSKSINRLVRIDT